MTTQNNNVEGWEKKREKTWKVVEPLVEKMKAKYSPELNMDGLEPALTDDICEIVENLLSSHTASIEAKYREELKGKLEDKRAKLEGEHPKENIIANKAFNLGIDTAISLINNNQK